MILANTNLHPSQSVPALHFPASSVCSPPAAAAPASYLAQPPMATSEGACNGSARDLLVLVLILGISSSAAAGSYGGGAWGQAHATFYGGADASGTQGE